jgi:hypothetical protein
MSQTPWIKGLGTALFSAVFKRSQGEEVTETDSEKILTYPKIERF